MARVKKAAFNAHKKAGATVLKGLEGYPAAADPAYGKAKRAVQA